MTRADTDCGGCDNDEHCGACACCTERTTVSQHYSVTIITGIGNHQYPGLAEARAVTKADEMGLPVTVTRGIGFHPQWSSEPVLIITALYDGPRGPYLDQPAYPYRILAEHLRDAFDQDCVLFHATPVSPFDLI